MRSNYAWEDNYFVVLISYTVSASYYKFSNYILYIPWLGCDEFVVLTTVDVFLSDDSVDVTWCDVCWCDVAQELISLLIHVCEALEAFVMDIGKDNASKSSVMHKSTF